MQLTAQQRKEMLESKRLRIIATIARNRHQPADRRTAHPARIELAMEEAKVHIDPFKPVDMQVQQVLDSCVR